MTYSRVSGGKWKCNACGKIVEEYGWIAHNGWHKKQGRKEQTKLLGGEIYVKPVASWRLES